MAKTYAALLKGSRELSGSGRVSRLMKSGKSGSVAVRRRTDDQKTLFVLDITIDPDGRHLWLDPGEDSMVATGARDNIQARWA